jgi:hypothetical protein
MKDKKLQVFVSSTYTHLKEERPAAVEAILSSGHIQLVSSCFQPVTNLKCQLLKDG